SQKLIFSFHGLPKRNLELGDPYHCECHQTARLIAEKLNLSESRWKLTFQSRFGKAEWMQPYTIKTMEELPGEGVKSIDVFCPGFSADCIETLEEISLENRDVFLQAGGESFSYIPALNAEAIHIDALANIVIQHIQGWPEVSSNCQAIDKGAARQRAVKLGAKQ
ncbi:MAG: ferrochelatase, partial [Gammaproteobacteria bacterium]|nr:ferrochelatase [Gammaproteobacteria bacterium]